ncbi:hypothetical protein CQ062_22330 [Ochrobactrum sp. MYb68]|nr:hypothetical protein CQ062_22330 [Ochrobactrum sp. MYb68]
MPPPPEKIRVFNADYVQLNIGHLDGYLKPILVIGEENKAAADALAADELWKSYPNCIMP